jgi:hypothetical protein
MVNWIKVISIILKAPLGIFILASFGGSIYAAINKIQGITWSTPIIMGSLILAYIVGIVINMKNNED